MYSFSSFKRVAAGIALGLLASVAASAQLSPGNIVVLQVGDGSTALSSASSPILLKEFTPSGTAGSSISVPATGASRLVMSGSATSEGMVTLSTDSLKLVISGYDTSVGFSSVNGSASANIARAIDTVSIQGTVGRAVSSNSAFSTNNFRCAVKSSGENYWGVGANTGVYYFGSASAAATILSTPANIRFLSGQNGKLYFATSSGLSRIGRINSQPTSGTATADTLITLGTGTTPSPYGLSVNSSETIIYVADDRTAANGGGIQKWTLSGGAWSIADTLVVGGTAGARGLAVNWSGTYPTLYTTTTDNRLVKIVDSAFAAGVTNTPVTLSTAGTNTAYRGVTFTPRCTPPVVSLTASGSTTFCAGGSVTLTATTVSGASYQWYNGTAVVNGATGATYAVTATGAYSVQVTTASGCAATSAATTVTVNPAPAATITAASATTFCTGGSVVLNANTGTGLTYQWFNGTTQVASTGTSYTASASGSYTVMVTNANGCVATSAAAAVIANTPPVATVTASGPTTICAGDTVTLTANSGSGYMYQWYNANGTAIPNATSAIYKAYNSGSYTVMVSAGAGTACSATSSAVAVTVNPGPAANITAGTPGSADTVFICPSGTVTLNAGTTMGLNYQWKRNGTNIATGAAYTASIPGTYTVTVTNANSCSATSAAVKVVRDSIPSTVTANGALSFCAGDSVKLSVPFSTATAYQWSSAAGGGLSNANMYTYTATMTGAYTATLIHTNASGNCTFISNSVAVTAKPLPQPVAVFMSGTLSVAGTYTSYQWLLAGQAITGATAANHTPVANGSYSVRVDSNGCAATSAVINVSGLGVEALAAAGVRLYPNPATGIVNVTPANMFELQVKDVQGRVLLAIPAASNFDVSILADGVYFATLSRNGVSVGTIRFVKNAH